MIRAIFYSKFDVREGPKVVHQVPNGSITSSSTAAGSNNTNSNGGGGGGGGTPTLIHWPSISSTIIPRQSFCSLPLSLLTHPYRVLSHPICLSSSRYERNEFIFSFSLVLHHRTATPAYASVVSKLAELFKHLEETSGFLSGDPSAPNTGRLYALCEILLEDLNNYCETMIPIDEQNTLNIKLFPTYPPPPPLRPAHVPLPTVRLERLIDPNWDLTMLRILPYVDGINSLRAISRKADADYVLVRKAVAHLLYYGCVTLLDVFTFGASYAPTAEIGALVRDTELQDECRQYVLAAEAGPSANGIHAPMALAEIVDSRRLIELYCSLRQGLAVRNWCMEHADIMGIVDIRRFITFGVIKGLIYRIHKYAITTIPSERQQQQQRGGKDGGLVDGAAGEEQEQNLEDFLDGTHTFDEICTELQISEKELLVRLKPMRDVQIIQR